MDAGTIAGIFAIVVVGFSVSLVVCAAILAGRISRSEETSHNQFGNRGVTVGRQPPPAQKDRSIAEVLRR